MTSQKPLIGAHLSIVGGLHRALEAAHELNIPCVQLFTHSNRQWSMPPISDQEIDLFIATRKRLAISHVVAHASYLLNVGSPKAAVRHMSQKALIHELERCEQLEIETLVLHPGSALDASKAECINHIADALNEALAAVSHKHTVIALETMAGQGSSVGRSFEELADIRSKVEHKHRIGFCLDTCHLHAAGYDITTPEAYAACMREIETTLGIKTIKVIHMNDSVQPFDSHVDRHADIGKGTIGLAAFTCIMHDARWSSVPKILETPYTTQEDNIRNIATLRSL